MAVIEAVLKKIYYEPGNPGSFGGVKPLYLEASKKIPDLKISQVKDWLSKQLTYTLHKSARRKFKRNPIIAERPHEQLQADLVDMKDFSQLNDGHKYILTAVDVFTKKGFAVPIKDKSMKLVCEAMEKILRNHETLKLMTDEGTEFKNNMFKNLMKKYDIHHYFARNKEIKCANVERFNRTLKDLMFRYFTLKGNRRYIDTLDSFLKSYNNRYHRAIRMKPSEVNDGNHKQVFRNLYGFQSKRDFLRNMSKPKLAIDDTVRQKYRLSKHDRGYYPNWSDNIYKVFKSIPGASKPYYWIKDEKDNIIKKRFYPEELQKVKSDLFRVEKIIRERKYRGKKQYFVKWLNHSEEHNSWIPAENLTNIGDG